MHGAPGFFRSRRSLRETAQAALIGLVAFVLYFAASAPSPTWSESPDASAFSPQTSSAAQYVRPVFGTPDTGGYHVAGLLARALLALPVGSDTAQLRFMAAVLGALAVMLGVLIIRRLGCEWGPATASGVVLMLGGTAWSRAMVPHPGALTAVLLLGTVLSLLWWVDTRRPGLLWLMAGLYALGIGGDLTLVAFLPALVIFLRTVVIRPAERLRVVALCVAATAAGVLHHELAVLETWRAAPFLQLADGGFAASGTYREVGVLGRFSTGEQILTQLGATSRFLSAEFGLVGVGLVLAGVTKLVVDRPRLALLFGLSTPAVMIWAVVAPFPSLRASLVAPVLLMWLLVGVGVSWLMRNTLTRWSRALAVAVVLVLPASTLFTTFTATASAERASRSHFFTGLFDVLPEKTAMVAENDPFDRALTVAGRARRAASVTRVPREPVPLERLRRAGYSVVAGPSGRAWLELLGLGFERVQPEVPVTLPRYLDTIPPGSLVAAAGGLGLTGGVDASDTRTFGAIGGTADLFGSRQSFYGIVGVKNARRGIVERLQTDPVDLQLAAGDPVGAVAVRVPVSLRISSDHSGGRIEVNGQLVADTRTGLALVVVSPDGRLLDTHAFEYAGSLRIPMRPAGPSLARMYAAEPCREVGSESWVDVSEPGAAGRLGGLFGSGHASEELVIYFAGAHALEPRVDSQTGRPFDVEVAPFQTAEPGAAESLRRVLERDRFPDDGRLSRHAHVYRLGVRAGDAGPRALAVRLTGFPDQAFARVEGPGDGAARLRLCGAFSGSEPLLAGGVTSAALSGEAFDNHLVFPYGWHGVELDGRTRFRWMAAREAELVVEVARTGQIRLQYRRATRRGVDGG